jgi:hypothetical protein
MGSHLERIGGALFFLFANVSKGVTLETLLPPIFSSALEIFLGSNKSRALPEEVIANSPLTNKTLLIVYRSKTLSGPWQRQIISGDTCGGQSEGVLALPSPSGGPTSYIHISDIFATAPLTGIRTAAHGHQFQALLFSRDGTIQDLDCSLSKTFAISFSSGYENSTASLATTAMDSSTIRSPYSVSCNPPTYQLYQTWSSSKTGNLAEVGIAGDAPTGSLSITIFRFQNNTNFFTPRYVRDH